MIKPFLTSFLVLTLSCATWAAHAESVAYVIGMSKYKPAMNAEAEAARLAKTALTKAGYVTFGGENLTRKDTYRALEEFEARASNADRVVIFVAGKFASKGHANWLLLPGTKSRSAVAMARDAVSLEAILSTLDGHAGHSAAFLTEGAGPINGQHGLREGLGGVAMTSGSVVLRGTPRALTSTLAAALGRDANLADMKLPRDIKLIGSPGASLKLGAQPSSSLNTAFGGTQGGERAAWAVANAANTEAGYQAFLQQFPQGDFAGLARGRLSANAAPKINPAEEGEKSLRLSRNARRDVQRKLTMLGFNTRGVDGILGKGSRDAIRRFQRAEGFETTGYLTNSMLRTLERRASIRQAEIEEEERRVERQREDEDIRFWRSTGASGRPEDMRAYLKRYPEGLYANEARREMERLGYGSGNDEGDWDRAYRADTVQSYEAYLAAQPRGKFRRDAETRIRVLRQNAIERPTRNAVDPVKAEKALKLSQIDRASLELRLGSLGFNPGFPEGKLDKRARNAIAQFQQKAGLDATGYFDRATVDRIRQSSRK